MKEYILNNTPVRTANNFGINDIKLDLDVPTIKEFENVTIESDEIDKIKVENKIKKIENSGRIGLDVTPNYGIVFTIPENVTIENPIKLSFEFDEDNTTLADNIKIVLEKNAKADFILSYSSNNCENSECKQFENCAKGNKNEESLKNFHFLKQQTIAKENAKATITISNLLNEESDNFMEIVNDIKENAVVEHTLVELGGKNKISNYYTNLEGQESENNIKTIYIGKNDEIIDINYNIDSYGKQSKCNIELQGALDDNSKKNFKGIIDFKEGCTKSKGFENENCMLLSPKSKSKSLPVLLCHEEDVEGQHGVASGKLDEKKLFYIMTKGISYENAKKLIVKANFSSIIRTIKDEQLQKEIISKIDNL